MGLFGGAHAKGSSGGGFNFGNAFLNLLAPDIYRRQQELAYRRAQIAHQEQEAQTAADQSRMLQEGLGQLGFSKPEIQVFAAHPESGVALLQQRLAPHSEGAGARFTLPGVGGAPDQVSTVPTTDEQQAAFYDRTSPGMGAAFARRQALGPPVPIQQGGGLAVPTTDGGWQWGVAPEGVSPAPTGPAPAAGGGSARNNPGGLRYPGSTRFRSFPTEQAGVAAQESQIGRYLGRGINTVRSIIETYAPRRSRGGDNSDDQVNNYISHVRQRLGVDPDQPLPATAIPQVAAAMREFETGRRGASPRLNAGSARNAPSPGQAAALRAEAQRAIAAGADPAAVQARLRQMGVN